MTFNNIRSYPMAERVGYGTPCLLGNLGVQEVLDRAPKVRKVFRPARKLVRFSLLRCPSIPNSKLGRSPRGKCKLQTICVSLL